MRHVAYWGAYVFLMALLALTFPLTLLAAEENNPALSQVPCADHNYDVGKIAAAVRQGITKEKLFLHLGRGTGLEVERVKEIRALIEDAYKNEAKIMRWYETHRWFCGDAKSPPKKLIRAASSENVVPPNDPDTVRCLEKLKDHLFIARTIWGGAPRRELEEHARSAVDLTPEHLETVLRLINEAYSARDVVEWVNAYWAPCMREKEV